MAGLGSLYGNTQTLPDLYSLPAADFHDVTTGSTGPSPTFSAGPGYDLATGLGSPVANKLIPALINYQPTVTSISPTSGVSTGGTVVTITGTDLTGGLIVDFGSTPASNVTVISSTEIMATSPAGTGTVNVTVTGPDGVSATSAATQFTYMIVPTVTGITPAARALAGGTTVTITGTSFTGATAVMFGTTPGTNLTVVSATKITVTAPAGTGTVDVAVVNTNGASPTSSADKVTCEGTPTITGVSHRQRPLAGGATVTIIGTNLAGATQVDFGTQGGHDRERHIGTQIVVTSPRARARWTSRSSILAARPPQCPRPVQLRRTADRGHGRQRNAVAGHRPDHQPQRAEGRYVSGKSTLTYTWAATLPAELLAPKYSVNGTNGSKNTTATFSQPGA